MIVRSFLVCLTEPRDNKWHDRDGDDKGSPFGHFWKDCCISPVCMQPSRPTSGVSPKLLENTTYAVLKPVKKVTSKIQYSTPSEEDRTLSPKRQKIESQTSSVSMLSILKKGRDRTSTRLCTNYSVLFSAICWHSQIHVLHLYKSKIENTYAQTSYSVRAVVSISSSFSSSRLGNQQGQHRSPISAPLDLYPSTGGLGILPRAGYSR